MKKIRNFLRYNFSQSSQSTAELAEVHISPSGRRAPCTVLIALLLLLLHTTVYAQSGDSLLRNERSMDRPLIVHDGQLRILTNYTFAAQGTRFDEKGDKIKLSDQGNIGFLHDFNLHLEYGFLELFQIMISAGFQANNQRTQPIAVFTTSEISVINQVNAYTGLKDLFTGANLRIPFTGKELDIVLNGGVTIPVASSEPDQPEHSVQSFVEVIDRETEINYLYNENMGLGVVTATVGGQIKYRFTDFAISAYFDYRFPTAESESLSWTHRLVGTNQFEYQSTPYAYLASDDLWGMVKLEYQLYPYLELFLDLEYRGATGGWSEESGRRVAFRDQSLGMLNPGVEILLTPRFWLRQRVLIGVLGENRFSPLGIETNLIYNLFPFQP